MRAPIFWSISRTTSLALAALLALSASAGCGDDTLTPEVIVITSGGDDGTGSGSGNGTGDGSGTIVIETTCTPGTPLCACAAGACPGGPGLACIDDVCVYPECTVGEPGCACFPSGACGLDEYGRQGRCQGGICEATCPQGAIGCGCAAGDACEEGLVCGEDDLCTLPTCDGTGVLGCPCNTDRSCETGAACVLGACEDLGDCVPGAEDCPCRRDGACDDGLSCDTATDHCVAIDCTPGAVGCACLGGACVGDDVVCTDGLCEIDHCPAGEEGCECLSDRCGMNERGEALVCTAGVCTADSCVPGELGCVCSGGIGCEDGASCDGGFCIADGCVPGERDCTCAGSLCDDGLSCRAGAICVDNVGYIGGPCGEGDACERGGRCSVDLCVSCFLGTNGCACNDAGDCGRGLACVGDLCVPEEELVAVIPDDPQCYTPCTDAFTDALGVYHACPPSTGLMPGCIGELSCVGGSCVAAGEAPPMCASDVDCPDFQACMEGQCYSNCESDGDCGLDTECYRYVCRTPCTSADDDCPDGTYCALRDERNGFCMPEVGASGAEQLVVDGMINAYPFNLSFSNVDTETLVTITNDSPEAVRVRVRKLEHQAYFDDGSAESLLDFDDADECDPLTTCPLYWLGLAEVGGEETYESEIEVVVPALGEADFLVRNAGGSEALSWTGTLELVTVNAGTVQLPMRYVERMDGQWRGVAFYYSQFQDEGLADWAATPQTRNNAVRQGAVGNAFVQRWGAFRSGRAVSWEHMQAVMVSTQTEAWRDTSDLAACRFDACYLWNGEPSGVAGYTSDFEAVPVPTGVTEMPFTMNIFQPEPHTDPDRLAGRIESSNTLHYAGNPAVELRLQALDGGDDDECNASFFGACLRYVESFDATIHVGGRYAPGAAALGCDAAPDGSYLVEDTPWLLDDFRRDTFLASGVRYRTECRDSLLPFDPDAAEDPLDAIEGNLSLAGSNPIPDGRPRVRTLRLLDGVLVNGSTLVILFEERMDSFFATTDAGDAEGIAAYGYLVLEREPVELPNVDLNNNRVPDIYDGSVVVDERAAPDDVLSVACTPEILADLGLTSADLDEDRAADVISQLIDGIATTVSSAPLDHTSVEQVHYLCVDTGLIDGGTANGTAHGVAIGNDDSCAADIPGVCQDGGFDAAVLSNACTGGSDVSTDLSCIRRHSECALGTDAADCSPRTSDDRDVRVGCPVGSEVIYFTVDSTLVTQADIAALDCQDDGTCQDTLNDWLRAADPIVQVDPVFTCASGGAYCDRNRFDLRDGKQFYPAGTREAVLPAFRAELAEAFRYRTRFQNRATDDVVGFAPEVCQPNSNQTPYCCDPEAIEHLRERVDCLLSLYGGQDDLYLSLEATGTVAAAQQLDNLDDFLVFNFSVEEGCLDGSRSCDCDASSGACDTFQGFERLYAELLIMMGDEAFTRAFSSRFDLAGVVSGSFEGEAFEAGGINLSGVAGYELRELYAAAQYYQEALDRFYALSPLIWLAVSEDLADQRDTTSTPYRASFVTPEMVTTYMERLLRASTQKSRALSAVAERYLSLNRPDLARQVIERAYTGTYLESAVISRLMQRIRDSFIAADRPQIEQVLSDSQLRFRMAMLTMRNVYASISDDTTFYGLDPDYIPLPTLNFREDNGFEKIFLRAQERVSIARAREEAAIASTRSYETDAAQFQAELNRIRTTYESQLGQLCGTFEADDGRIYPAIRRYAPLADWTAAVGDPCGLAGNGSLYDAMLRVDIVGVQIQQLLTRYANVFERIEIERARVSAHCEFVEGMADYTLCLQTGDTDACANVPADAPLPECPAEIFDELYNLGANLEELVEIVPGVDVEDFLGDLWGETECSVLSLNDEIHESREVQRVAHSVLGAVNTLADLAKCSGLDCPLAATAVSISLVGQLVNELVQANEQDQIDQAERELQLISAMQGHYQTTAQCEQFDIDSEAQMRNWMLELNELDLEMLRTQYELQLALSEIQRTRNEAQRLQLEQEEVEQLTINVEAARNDPNVRLYRNDAIINADIAFEDAIRQAYRLTRVYEYYTSSSYANRDQLYLTRMVGAGDYNLENYLVEIQNAFMLFEETYGSPDPRVQILSLRDDILRIPRTDELGRALDQSARTAMLREHLADPALLDASGYLTIPFSTSLDELSPLTRVHKISYIEVDIIASDYGDEVGRVYLRYNGTGTVHALDDGLQFHRFPERTAVIDTFFGGTRYFDPEIYRSYRLQHHPMANTSWELVINQRDEPANQDINLQSVTDIRLYVYYNDFTPF